MAKRKTGKGDLSESVHRIWLAGLGALAAAEEEGGKLFTSLVGRGRKYESALREPVDRAATRVQGTVQDVRGRASRTVQRIEQALDERVEAALHRVGVPTRREIAQLTRKVQRLTEAVEGRPRRATKERGAARKKVPEKKPE